MPLNTRLRLLSAAIGVAALLMVGCGSGGGTSSQETGSVVTSRSESNYSMDALVLASRDAGGPGIPATDAAAVDADLAAIRAQVPRLNDVHARPTDDLKSILVHVTPDAPFLENWKNGTSATGQGELDGLLARYKTKGVQHLATLSGSPIFVLRFEDPLNTKALITPVSESSPSITRAESNGMIGDGDQILRTVEGDKRVYAFSVGWGDCPAGCISRHTWTATVTPDGISIEESGAALPGDAGSGA